MRPYILAAHAVQPSLVERCPLPDPLVVDALDPESAPFFQLVNAGNRAAFGGLGMPAWVQLDCCTVPSAMVGFAVTREDCPDDVWGRLTRGVASAFGTEAARAVEAAAWVPVSEFCALPSVAPDTVVGVSLYALLPHRGLGVRTKALGLAVYGADQQVGITQYDNQALRTHTAFGDLQIVAPRAANHTASKRSFVYRLRVPAAEALRELARRGRPPAEPPGDAVRLPADADDIATRVEALLAEGPLAVTAPGLSRQTEPRLLLRRL